jgi:glycosyltransferase involved in cell wall biosynthesis
LKGSNFKEEFNISEEEIAVGMIGNIDKQKGTWNFLKAAGLAQKMEPHIKFRFFVIAPIPENLNYGWRGKLKLINTTNPYEKAVAIAKENNILKNTHFTNRRKDIFNVISGLDIVTACYNLYAIGRPGFEAAAVGTPVIVNKGHTGNSQIVKNNVTGLVVEKENPQALAKAIIHLAENKQLRISMGRNGIEHAKQNFDAEKNIKKIEAIYKRVLYEK